MIGLRFWTNSLKTRVTLAALGIFLIGIWSLALYASRMLREDMQRLLGEQQFSAVSYIAAEIDQELTERLKTLEKVAARISPAILGNAVAIQAFLDERLILQGPYNGGVIAFRADGTAVAETPVSIGRIGFNFIDRDHIASALKEGKATIGRPFMGRMLHAPIFAMAVPIRDAQGRVIGALSGVTDLGKPNFLDMITASRYGKTGVYFLIAPQYRLIVTSSNKNRIMATLPDPGNIPAIDRFLQGYEGSAVYVNQFGEEVLTSAKAVPVARWAVSTSLSTAEAFAPIRVMQERMLLATIFLTLLAGGLTWWISRRQLAPMLAAVETLTALSKTSQRPPPLPITRHDEIGQLIGGFNLLLETLAQREEALRENERLLSEAQSIAGLGSYVLDVATGVWRSSEVFDRVLGIDAGYDRSVEGWAALTHPEDREHMVSYFRNEVLGQKRAFDKIYRIIRQNDGAERWVHGLGRLEFDAEGRPLTMHGTIQDITERKQADEELMRSNAELEQFSYSISHDMRQPLRMISSYLQLLDMGLAEKLDPEKREYLNFAADGAKRLDQMLVALLEYSRVGRKGEPAAWVESRAVLDEALLYLRPAIAEAGANVSIGGDWPRIFVSPDEMMRLMQNLIGNAIKFRLAGRAPEIAVTGETMGEKWRLSIADNGAGIIPDQIGRLFQVFQRLHSRAVYEGTGVGLALCRKIAEHHRGRIWAESPGEGQGSVFRLELPLTLPPAVPVEPRQPAAPV